MLKLILLDKFIAMKALVYDGTVRLEADYPNPTRTPGWALLKVTRAGICRTDLELAEGYMGFRGVLGHEFTAHVTEADDEAVFVEPLSAAFEILDQVSVNTSDRHEDLRRPCRSADRAGPWF